MSLITLEMLAESATGSASRAATKSFRTMSIEDARAEVKIKDGNRKPNEDGSQKLTVVIGKHTLPMTCIKAGTSRIAVSADQVEGYTSAIQGLIDNGSFDEEIGKAQILAEAQYQKALANPVTRTKKVVVEDTAGLNLDDLDDEAAPSEADVSEAQVDLDEEL